MISRRPMAAAIVLTLTAALGAVPASAATRSLTVSNATVTEGNTDTKAMRFVVRLSSPARRAVKVMYATVYGSATAADLVAQKGELRFSRGQTKKTVAVAIKGDVLDEFGEGFTLKLSNARRARIGDGTGSGKIADNDAPPGLTINDVSVGENSSTSLAAQLSAPSGKTVTVHYAASDGTATSPDDYSGTTDTLTFLPGNTIQQMAVFTADDAIDEPDETLNYNLTDLVNATPVDMTGVVTITDDDDEPTLSISDASIAEGNTPGATLLSFTVSLSSVSGKPVSVVADTTADSATAPADYTDIFQTVQIPAGDASGQAVVQVTSDTLVEDSETFEVDLLSPTHATISDGNAVGTITNDDSCTPDLPASTTNTFLGTVSGDTGAQQLSASGNLTCQGDRKWYRVTVSEDNSGDPYLSGRVTLTPGGVPHYGSGDLDLFVWREDATTLIASSTLNGTNQETVNVRRDDDWGEEDTFTVYIEIRSFGGANSYDLNVLGNVAVAAENYPG